MRLSIAWPLSTCRSIEFRSIFSPKASQVLPPLTRGGPLLHFRRIITEHRDFEGR